MVQNVIALLFRFINLGILLAVFYYLFNKYLLASIKEQIQNKKKQLHDLTSTKDSLEYAQQEMDSTLVQQAQLCASLKEQIAQWRAKVDVQLGKREEEKKEIKERLAKRIEQQSGWLRAQEIKKRVLPTAIIKARKALEEQFAPQKTGDAFIKDTINQIKKSSS